MGSKAPEAPKENRSPKGTGENKRAATNKATEAAEPIRETEAQTENVKQNTSNLDRKNTR